MEYSSQLYVACGNLIMPRDAVHSAHIARIEERGELQPAAALREALARPATGRACRYDQVVAAVRVALGEDAFAAAWEAGRTMLLELATPRSQPSAWLASAQPAALGCSPHPMRST